MDAFDADVLVYAAVVDHPLGRRVRALLPEGRIDESEGPAGIGSVLLVPELLTKPFREGADEELSALAAVLARVELRPLDEATAQLGVVLGATYRLKPADAVHLATAVNGGADRFVTNNHRHFRPGITEIEVTYPEDLPDPGPGRSS